MLEQITPLILTYNEAPNIGRTLERLRWARDIVVVDSFSTDETAEIVSNFPQARLFHRSFDSHCNQWNFGLKDTGIGSEWVLALDADYIVSPELVDELRPLNPHSTTNGYRTSFIYCVNGKPIRGSAYPPGTTLFRRLNGEYVQDGHTQRIRVEGDVEDLRSPILHDDRKPLAHWVQAQSRYMKLEADKLSQASFSELSWPDRLRKTKLFAPAVMFFYCAFVKGAILDGRIGLFYSFQRAFSELLLSLYLFDHDLPIINSRTTEITGASAAVSPKAAIQVHARPDSTN